MFPNIAKELVRNQIRLSNLADLTGIKKSTLYDKYHGRSDFTMTEMFNIKDALHSDMYLDELFEKVKK